MAWIGKIVSTAPIKGADKIKRVDVVCGAGGKWSGVMPVEQPIDSEVVVFMPDAIVPDSHPELKFMEKHKYRVKMMRLKGCPSEILALPYENFFSVPREVGTDVTSLLGVKKYEKEPPPEINGQAAGLFPSFIPKTDELNFQKVPDFRDALVGNEFYATVKYDGTSQTIFHNNGVFGACSRNLEIKKNDNSAVWVLIKRFDLENQLPLFGNIALQWECIGPRIQGNPLKLQDLDVRLFNAYDINEKEYLGYAGLIELASLLRIPLAKVAIEGTYHDQPDDVLRDWAKGNYDESGTPREGLVVRPKEPMRIGQQRLSFKIINLDYKEA